MQLTLSFFTRSLSNYSSGGGGGESSRHSSLDDSGVFNDDIGGLGGGLGEGDKLRVQMPMPPPEGSDVINLQQGQRKPSRINIPFIVSIGEQGISQIM